MKTKEEIEGEIEHLIANINEFKGANPKAERKMRKKISGLRSCLLILQHYQAEGLLVKMRDECVHKVDIYNRRLDEYVNSIPPETRMKMKNPKTYYYKKIAPNEKVELKSAKHQLLLIKTVLSN